MGKGAIIQYGLTRTTIEWANGADLAPEFLHDIGTVFLSNSKFISNLLSK